MAAATRAETDLALEQLTVVVVNFGTAEVSLRCVRALLQDGVPPHRIVIVDNGSRDGSAARLQAELPECRHLALAENVGYVLAATEGVRSLEGAHYLFVNNDAFVHRPGSVHALLACLADDRVGIVVPRALNEDLTLQRTVGPLHTPAAAVVLASGLSRLVPNRWQPSLSTHWDHATARAVPTAAGVVMLVRGETWERIGGFRLTRMLYADDTDLSWRARSAGWSTWFAPEAEFVHLGSATTSAHWGAVKRCELVAQADAESIRRNLSPLAAHVTLGVIQAGLVARAVVFRLLRRPVDAAMAVSRLRGYRLPPDDGPELPSRAD